MEKETLEKAAHKIVMKTTLYGSPNASIGSSARSYYESELRCVLLGMEWQQEQLEQELQYFRDKEKTDERTTKEIISGLYTEEEALNLIFLSANYQFKSTEDAKEWFKQFKKKY